MEVRREKFMGSIGDEGRVPRKTVPIFKDETLGLDLQERRVDEVFS